MLWQAHVSEGQHVVPITVLDMSDLSSKVAHAMSWLGGIRSTHAGLSGSKSRMSKHARTYGRTVALLVVCIASATSCGTSSEETPLVQAILDHDYVELERLVESGANLNENDYLGYSPVATAARTGDLSAMNILLDAGADVDTPLGPHGVGTPLGLAVKFGHVETARALLANGARADLAALPPRSPSSDPTSPVFDPRAPRPGDSLCSFARRRAQEMSIAELGTLICG